jgi:hypothetical protein
LDQGASLLLKFSGSTHSPKPFSPPINIPKITTSTANTSPRTQDTHHLSGPVRQDGNPSLVSSSKDDIPDGPTQTRRFRAVDPIPPNTVSNANTPTRSPISGISQLERSTSTKLEIETESWIISQLLLQKLSKSITEDLAKNFQLDRSYINKAQNIVEKQIKNMLSEAQTSKKSESGEPSPRQKRVRCRICNKTMDRPCDLKKHEKRHSRPWGCTSNDCHKTFGSKNDWKRHENSQHFQLETWRCHEHVASSKIGECARIFFRKDPYQAHLRRDHSITDEEYIKEQSRQRLIGRNNQSNFWCGFCKEIIKLKKRGLDAWDERFNHIDDNHFKRGQSIEDWYPLDKDLPKGKLKSRATAEDDAADVDPDANIDSDVEQDATEESEHEEYPVSRTKRPRSDYGSRTANGSINTSLTTRGTSSETADQDRDPDHMSLDEHRPHMVTPMMAPNQVRKTMTKNTSSRRASRVRQQEENVWFCVSFNPFSSLLSFPQV